jgi:methylglutaconyl-CoA hydratase
MSEGLLLMSEREGIVTLTLNRTDAANALSLALLDELLAAYERIRYRNDVRVVIITGTGNKAFCAGADLKERAGMDETQVRQTVAKIRAAVNGLEELPMPVIAAVNGVAYGGGTELCLAADIRIAAASAKFGLTETSLAIIPGAGGTQRLSRLVGVAVAKELIFTARRIDAETAKEIGLVSKVVSDDELLTHAHHLAEEISANGPLAVRQAKFAINRGIEVDLQTGLAIEAKAYEVIIPTEDRLEGLRAFKEKRKPNYLGR